MVTLLKSKIHGATVTDANINYQGSITISRELCEEAGLCPYEKVLVVDVTNGSRLETYVIVTETVGVTCLNGAAARLVSIGDTVIIMSFRTVEEPVSSEYMPVTVFVDKDNRFVSTV